MICVINSENQIVNIVNTDRISDIDTERPYYPWNNLWEQYTDIEPFSYTQNRYIEAVGAEFARRRDAIRFIEVEQGKTYGFDCAVEDIANFMAAYTPLLIKQDGSTGYKVWLDESAKGLVILTFADMDKAYNTVRDSQLSAYAWYGDIKAKLLAVTEAEGKEKLEEIYPLGG